MNYCQFLKKKKNLVISCHFYVNFHHQANFTGPCEVPFQHGCHLPAFFPSWPQWAVVLQMVFLTLWS